MTKKFLEKTIVFKDKQIRWVWNEKEGKWYFSVVDIIGILIDQQDFTKTRKYWNKLAERLRKEGSETVTNCHQLKLLAEDGKMRLTAVADVENLFRIIQSVPSPKAEPIKLWLAKVGNERIEEIADPEKSLNRARENWQKLGRSEKWIEQRMLGQETRNKLTDYWKNHEVKEKDEFAILTNIIHQEWSGLSVRQHKEYKDLKNQNLRDHMTEAELIFTALAELSTRQIAESVNAKGLQENTVPAKKGGGIAKHARVELEEKTGQRVVSPSNYLFPIKRTEKLKRKRQKCTSILK